MKRIYTVLAILSLGLFNSEAFAGPQLVTFDKDTNNVCFPYTITFNNTSSLDTAGKVFYWTIQGTNVNDSISFDFAYTFTQPGNYWIQLRCDSMGIDFGNYQDNIDIIGFNGMLDISPDTIICPNTSINVQIHSNYDSLMWNWGDGSQWGQGNWNQHIYGDTGIYTLELYYYGQCGDTIIYQNIHVDETTTTNVTISGTQEACPNDEITFGINNSGSGYSAFWDFGDGNTSTSSNPTYSFADTGTYTIALTFTNSCGQVSYDTVSLHIDTMINNFDVNNFNRNPWNPCPNTTVNFSSNTVASSYRWVWTPGDTTSGKSVVHTFDTVGNYNVELIVTNGCGTSKSTVQAINVQLDLSNPPSAQFQFNEEIFQNNPDTVDICLDETLSFYNNSWNGNGETLFTWYFGDGDSSVSRDPSHKFTNTGLHQVDLIAWNVCGAADTMTKYVKVDPLLPPNPDFQVLMDSICQGETVLFFDDSQGQKRGSVYDVWFGDGDSLMNITTEQDTGVPVLAQHVYNSLGTYPYLFTVTNVCGNSDTAQGNIVVGSTSPSMQFYYVVNSTIQDNGDTNAVCPNDTVLFTGIGGISVMYDFGDGNSGPGESNGLGSAKHTYAAAGIYNAKAIFTDGCGGMDTVDMEVFVDSSSTPNANAWVSNTSVCGGDTITFQKNNWGGGNFNNIDNNTYMWTFGDGDTSYGGIVTHVYAMGGNYTAQYTMTNNCGSSSQQWNINITQASPYCSGLDSTYCNDDDPVSLIGLPSGGTWSGSGVSGSMFDPANAGVGIHTIVYTTYENGCYGTCEQTVEVLAVPAVIASANDTICEGESSLITVTGANTYAWSPSGSLDAPTGANVIATPTTSTTYTVIGTDANGCANTDSVTITVNPVPMLVASANDTICIGSASALSASGANSYSWTPSASLDNATIASPTATPSNTTTYTVVGTSDGCSDTANVIIAVNALPTVIASADDTICIGADAAALSVIGALTYNWLPASGLSGTSGASVSATPTVTTTYTVTGTDANGCKSSDAVQVVAKTPPSVSIVPSADTICNGEISNLRADGASTYDWSPGGSLDDSTVANVFATISVTSTYTVIGTDANGCVDTASVEVVVNNLPTVTASTDDTICDGQSSALTASGATTYSWSPSGSLDASTGANVNASASATTTYIVIGTDANGCSNTAMVTVVVNALPTVAASADDAICIGASSALNVSGANSYSWSPSGSLSTSTGASVTATPTITTTYTVIGTDANGCANSDSVMITVNNLPIITASADVSICTGDSTTLTAGGASTYSWTPNTGLNSATGSSVNASPASNTTYTVSGTDGNGCANTDTVIVAVNELPVVSFTDLDTIYCIDRSAVTMTGSPSGGTFSGTGVIGDTFDPGTAGLGTHTVSYTYTDGTTGCINSVSIDVLVDPCTGTIGGSVQTEKDLLIVYPNPNQGEFTIILEGLKNETEYIISITDLSGKEVMNKSIRTSNGMYRTDLDISGQAQGTYMLNVYGADKTIKKTIIIQ